MACAYENKRWIMLHWRRDKLRLYYKGNTFILMDEKM